MNDQAQSDRIRQLKEEVQRLRKVLDEAGRAWASSSEPKFNAIADSIDQMIWSTTPDGQHDYFNRRWYEYTGVPEGSTDGEAWNGVFHPDDQERAWTAWRHSLETGEAYHIEYRLRHRSGRYRWVLGRARPVRDEAGEITRWYGTCTDIHETKRAEERVSRSEDRFRVMADSLPVPAWVTGHDGIEFVNQGFADFCGSPAEELVGDRWERFVHPDDLPILLRMRDEAHSDVNPFAVEVRARRADGEWRTLQISARPRFAATGKFDGYVGVATDLTEIRAAEQAVRESEAQLRAIFEATPECIKIVAPDGSLMQMNWAGLCMIEAPGAEIVAGASVYDLISPEHRDEWRARHARIVAGESMNWEFEITGLQGTRRRMETHAVPLPLPDGRNAQLAVTRDITHRTEAQNKLRESEQRFRQLADTAPALIWMSDESANITFANRWYYETFGRPADEMLGDGWKAIVYPDDLDAFFGGFMAAFERRETYVGEVRVIDKQGDVRWLSCLGTPRFDPGGQFLGYTGVNLDVTGRRESEEALRESEERFRTLADNMPALCWWADAGGYIYWYNRRWYEYTGTVPEDMEGWGWQSVHDPQTLPAVMERWTRSIESGEPFEMTFPLKGADGEFRPFLTRIVPLRDDNGAIVRWFGTNTDIAGEKKLADALSELNASLEERVADAIAEREQAEEALRQSQKMETLGQLTGGVAHDFNNLLQIVSGNLDLLRRNLPEDNPRLRRAAENAQRGAERAAVLTQRLLAFSRRQPLAPKRVDPNKLVAGMSELLHRTLGETTEVETVLAPRLWAVEVDPHQLENALLNLAVNARDAMADGGKLTIETSNIHLDHSYVVQNAEVVPGQYVQICVTDTGAGMNEETAARAFEPFFTTKEVGKGTGLGLSMVYGFVKQSGGHLKIYSELGEGTTVKIYLPRLIGEGPSVVEQAPEATPAAVKDETILVCEDDADVRDFTVEVLRELGYKVLEAEDGPAALRILKQDERVDLLFTDVVLPSGMTGEVLAKQAQELRPGLKVLFTTGYARNAIVHQGRLDSGVELITKPFGYADLAARVRDIIDDAR